MRCKRHETQNRRVFRGIERAVFVQLGTHVLRAHNYGARAVVVYVLSAQGALPRKQRGRTLAFGGIRGNAPACVSRGVAV